MKITCHACDAKYTIADEKVTGRTVKIKCKKCGATIVVNADQGAASAPAAQAYEQQQPAGDDDGMMATRVANEAAAIPSINAAEWTVSINDQEQQMSQLQIAEEIQRGTVNGDTYVWRDGMSDWMSVSQVPELTALLARAAPVQDEPNMGLAGTIVMTDSPAAMSPFAAAPRPAAGIPAAGSPAFPQPAQGAARRANRAGASVDVFQAAAETREAERPRPPPPVGKLGERNENSVLFSLSALTATENAAAKSSRDDAVLDLGLGGRSNGKGSAVDDLMNLGGGMMSGPMLAPPPLLAPVVEPPPAPVPVSTPMPSTMASAAPAQFVIPAPPPKSKTPLIAGAIGGVVVIGGIIAFIAIGGSKPEDTTPATTASATVTSAPTPSVTASAAPSTTEAPAASGSAAPAASGAALASNDTSSGNKGPSSGTGGGGPKPKDTGSTASTASAKASAEPAPAPTPSATPAAPTGDPGAGAGRDFNKGAATTALAGAASAAKGCKGSVTGSASVRVVFAPSGNVTSANVSGAPFAGTPQGGCIAAAFRGAHVPPFDGSPVAVSKTVNIN